MRVRRGCRPASRKERWWRSRKKQASMRRWRRQWMNRRTVSDDYLIQQCYRCKFKTQKIVLPVVMCCSCRKYLCPACFDIHKRSPITGNHGFLDVSSTAGNKVESTKSTKKKHVANSTDFLKGGRFNLEKKVNVRAADDKQKCWIIASVVLTPDMVLLADYNNKCLKKVNISCDLIVANYDLKTLPRQQIQPDPLDICKLPGNRVAVALGHVSVIQFFGTKKGLAPDICLEVSGRCTSVDCFDDKLAVLYTNPEKSIEVMTLQGKVLHRIANSPEICLFRGPCAVKMFKEDGRLVLYYSDYTYTRKLTIDGESEWFCMLSNEIGPRGACLLGKDQLLVCGIFSNTIFMVPAPPDSPPTPVLDTNVCVRRPMSVTFCGETRRLIVSCQNCDGIEDYLHVYRQK